MLAGGISPMCQCISNPLRPQHIIVLLAQLYWPTHSSHHAAHGPGDATQMTMMHGTAVQASRFWERGGSSSDDDDEEAEQTSSEESEDGSGSDSDDSSSSSSSEDSGKGPSK
jgi:hypothetical protein